METIVVRRHSTVAHEAQVMRGVRSHGLPVPLVFAVDDKAQLYEPSMTMEFINGTTDVPKDFINDAVKQMARFLSQLHSLNHASFDLPVSTIPSRNRPCVLQGDFWPGNVLWREHAIAAVIDWEDTSIGDPLADLATARIELFAAFGDQAMRRFTDHYLSADTTIDTADLPYWEYYASAGALAAMDQWGLEPDDLANRQTMTTIRMNAAVDAIRHSPVPGPGLPLAPEF
ncbi:MAG: phosphotransferase [Acidimicrobiales bacterium]